MNNFGVNLTGKKVIYKKGTFYKPNATRVTRTFLCEGGPGCEPDGTAARLGLMFGPRTISGHWPDGTRDTINSGELEAYIDDAGNEIEAPVEKVKIDAYVAEAPLGHVNENIKPAKPKSGALQTAEEAGLNFTTEKAKNSTTEKANDRKAKAAAPAVTTTGGVQWDEAKVIELFKSGMKTQDIAMAMGYPKGSGNNRTKGVLKKAGLL